ncbi:DUF5621 domain-containing protein [Legionella maioricensis]|uniref:DUF5621 domain-containing protein n=1 Tax=Legionella maioricensis TaxID=2896528 RepID=A0A9X2CYC9_9GAMM|nr:DUF5621 domain-containing protein [Legionella maioricensis]MCL9683155.1 DUF5621 domain-containing protein [Legionella maioricensis]MCL9688054.1 DUF5621 domain-containing protein [Legionella maioricensis]
MANFTLFAYGTGESHEKTHNIVSQFAKSCVSKSIHLNGPDWLGRKVQPNAEEGAREIIKWLKAQSDDKNSINMTGFSRGSVTCIRIANILQSKKDELEKKENQDPESLNTEDKKLLVRLKQLDLNLFLMDPVAGLMDKSVKESRVIPEIVTNYVAVLQKDERRRDFKPQDMTRIIVANPQKTNVTLLPMYGNHSDTTKIKSKEMDSGPILAWYALHQFLTQNGTKFAEDKMPQIAFSDSYLDETGNKRPSVDLPPNPSPRELLKLFTEHHQNRPAYLKSGLVSKLNDGIPAPRTERTLNDHAEFYVKNSEFFVNQLERELFKIAYPKSFNYLFENNMKDRRFPTDSGSEKAEVIQELEELRKTDPVLFRSLGVRGVKGLEGDISVGDPRGYNYLEPCTSMQQIFPDLVPDSVKENAAQMNKLDALEKEVYRVTFQYEREKSELNFADDRSKTHRTQQIRKEINYLIKHDTKSVDQKYELILDQLEQHHQELILSNSPSELTHMLGKVLAEHGRVYEVQQSVTNAVMVDLIHSTLSLAKETVRLVGNLGYVGGYTLYAVGSALEAIGKRTNELIGDIGYNPLKLLGAIGATLLEGVGFMIKNSFGLKPLTQLLTEGIKELRDALTQAINTTTIKKIDPKTIENLEGVLADPSAPLIHPHDATVESTNTLPQPTTGYRAQMQHLREEEDQAPSLDSGTGLSILTQ